MYSPIFRAQLVHVPCVLLLTIRRPERGEQILATLLSERPAILRVEALESIERVLTLLGHFLLVQLVLVVLRGNKARIPAHEAAPRELASALGIREGALFVEIIAVKALPEHFEHLLKLGQRKLSRPASVD